MISKKEHFIAELKAIGVDPSAYNIFEEKMHHRVVKLNDLSCAQANVLKQTALICGADAAIPKHVYAGGKKRRVSVLLIASDRELGKIHVRLCEQAWLLPVAQKIDAVLHRPPVPSLHIGRKRITFSRTYIMGILNITDDSFYKGSRYTDPKSIQQVVEKMAEDGVDIIDIGAESSRPGARSISAKKEIARLSTIIPKMKHWTRTPFSIDTYKAPVASFAIDHGAQIVNDISGLRHDKNMARVIARNKVGVIIMHMKGTPRTMQRHPHYKDCMGELHEFFTSRIAYVVDNGVEREAIIIDPGLGFGKRLNDNYDIINRLTEFKVHERPILAGHSRKSFIGKPFDLAPEDRLEGSLGIEALLIEHGASIIRVHDVKEAKRVARLIDTVLS